jgi:hypothetical protein
MKNPLLALALTASTLTTANAVTFNIGLDGVRDADGNFVSGNTLALIVVDTGNDGFSSTFSGSGVAGQFLADGSNDYIAWRGDFSASGADGVFFDTVVFNISAPIANAQNFALYWLPGLTTGDALSVVSSHGFYSSANSTQFDSSSAWNVGSNNGAQYNLNAFTVNNTGNLTSNPDLSGLDDSALTATNAIPEPSTFAMLAGLGVLGCAILRRKR